LIATGEHSTKKANHARDKKRETHIAYAKGVKTKVKARLLGGMDLSLLEWEMEGRLSFLDKTMKGVSPLSISAEQRKRVLPVMRKTGDAATNMKILPTHLLDYAAGWPKITLTPR
jgi:hypothetical protein